MKRLAQHCWLMTAALACLCWLVSAHATNSTAQNRNTSQSSTDASVLFAKNCATCHGKDGQANTFKSKHHLHARNLTDAMWQANVSDERLFNSITNGLGKMPAFGKRFSESQINALVAYVRQLKK